MGERVVCAFAEERRTRRRDLSARVPIGMRIFCVDLQFLCGAGSRRALQLVTVNLAGVHASASLTREQVDTARYWIV